MRQFLHSTAIHCPYCGEEIDILVDCSVPSQDYFEDCSVCCRPIAISVTAFDGELESLEVRSEDE